MELSSLGWYSKIAIPSHSSSEDFSPDLHLLSKQLGVPVLGYTGCIHVSMALVTSKWNAFSLFTYYNVLLITSKSNTKYRIL